MRFSARKSSTPRINKRKPKEQAKIITGFSCNNHCLFCYDRGNRNIPERTTQQIKREISAARKRGFFKLHLLGGEPTIRADILELVSFAREQGFSYIMLTTNGRMFSYYEFCVKIAQAGLSQAVFSIHGHNAKLHDRLTKVRGSFRQLLDGVQNIKKVGSVAIGTNTTIVKQNVIFIPEIAKQLITMNIQRADFIYVGARGNRFTTLVPKVSHAAASIIDVLEQSKDAGSFWRIQNVPMSCYFRKYLAHMQCAGYSEQSSFFRYPDNEQYLHAVRNKKLKWHHYPECKRCGIVTQCPGVWDEYAAQYGTEEISPVL